MQFRRSGKHTVEIVLSPEELDSLKLYPDNLDYEDPITRRILTGLLQRAADQTGLRLETGEFLVETGQSSGNTVLTITQKKKETVPEQIQVCRFDGCEEMLSGCIKLAVSGRCSGRHSSLYVWKGSYYLVICPGSEQSEAVRGLLLEYGHCALHGFLAAGTLFEHAACLLEEEALETLERYFSPAT